MTILVTGAGGFLGQNLRDALTARSLPHVALNDRPLTGGTTELADVRDRAALASVLDRHGVTAIIHAAAVTLAPGSRLTDVETAFDVNTLSTAILLEEARRAGVTRFVYPSSTAVYGAALYDDAPVDEATPPRPTSTYGYTKLASERLVAETAASFGLSCIRARITALFGPHERETATRDLMSLPFQLARSALSDTPVTLPHDHARDWTSARDVAEALVQLATTPDPGHDLYNLGLGKAWSPVILARALADLRPGWRWDQATPHAGLTFPDDPAAPRQPLLSDRYRVDFGAAFRTPEEACADYVDWLRDTAPAPQPGYAP
ncbi:NAD-dependent epimerase/dehydratase family protein [Allosediminivita pacifica]|uniref:UDP-glucose 4-epimerase n=1 Tax=Allosediminivita pacifica TaxID=1267769 RepID=A0A2T6AR04_9RHOB|nr:NAD(P)-dependent oxidoreductase [Allosediminivita pacifica]PTX46249.1 UDP-glucose 4-epimerase [Allosediminivita pacifica]GGB17593.1 UDP-glucose 4-epimerase GalE [Allosediminivita pacifica]